MAANSVDWAHDAVDAVAESGAWGIKGQLLNPDTLTAKNAPRYDRLAGPDTQYQAFTGALPYSAWAEVYAHAREKGLEPFASCWDEAAVEASEDLLKPEWYKIGSADITHHSLIRLIAETGKNVILSTGAADESEIVAALDILWEYPVRDIVLMACSLSYPCALADARLSRIRWLDDMALAIDGLGYSDHVPLIETGALAVAAGASWLEKHFTVTPGAGGDHDFALNPLELNDYVDRANRAWTAMYHPEGNEGALTAELPARSLARRSLHAVTHIHKGDRVTEGVNVRFLRPAEGGLQADAVGPWYAERDYLEGEQI